METRNHWTILFEISFEMGKRQSVSCSIDGFSIAIRIWIYSSSFLRNCFPIATQSDESDQRQTNQNESLLFIFEFGVCYHLPFLVDSTKRINNPISIINYHRLSVIIDQYWLNLVRTISNIPTSSNDSCFLIIPSYHTGVNGWMNEWMNKQFQI